MSGEAIEAFEGHGAAGWRRFAAPLPFACLYLSFGATFGLLGGGAPLVLRAHGVSLDRIGLVQLMYLPIGVTFLWAPLIDRKRLPGLPHRIGWISTAQIATIALLVAMAALIASGAPTALAAMLALALCVSVAQATMDIALEALVVETVARARRPMVTTAKLCGSSIGTMIGIGLATLFPAHLSLAGAMLVVACLDAAMLLPILRTDESHPADRSRNSAPAGRLAALGRLPSVSRRALVLGGYFAPALMLSSATSLALLDLKVPLRTVGLFSGVAGTLIGVATTLTSGALLTRVAGWRLVSCLAVGVAAAALLFAVASAIGLASLGLAAGAIGLVFDGGMGVPVFNVIYRWAEGPHPATDYAVLFGVAFLVSFPARILGPMLASAIGWPAFYLVGTPIYLAAVAVLVRAMRATGPSRDNPERDPA